MPTAPMNFALSEAFIDFRRALNSCAVIGPSSPHGENSENSVGKLGVSSSFPLSDGRPRHRGGRSRPNFFAVRWTHGSRKRKDELTPSFPPSFPEWGLHYRSCVITVRVAPVNRERQMNGAVSMSDILTS